MAILETATAGVKILGGLKGLFGKKDKPKSPSWNILSQAEGAREAAEKYGFNPLTMLQYGQPGGALGGGGGEPPLASIDLLTGGLDDLGSILSGDRERQRAADQLALDLAKLKLEQARSGVVAVAPSAASGVGDGQPVLGGSTPRMVSYGQAARPFGMGVPSLVHSGEPREDGLKSADDRGTLWQTYEMADGTKRSFPVGPDLDELVTGGAIAVGDLAWNVGKAFGNYIAPGQFENLKFGDFFQGGTWNRPLFVPDPPRGPKQAAREQHDYLQPNYWLRRPN